VKVGGRLLGKVLASAEGPLPEARTAEAGMRFFGRGRKPPVHQLGGLREGGERCKLLRASRAEQLAPNGFPIFKCYRWLLLLRCRIIYARSSA